MSALWLIWVELLVSHALAQLPPLPSGDAPNQDAGPRLVVQERKLKLGETNEGDKVTVKWLLENQGNADLVIERTKTSCGCARVELADEEKVIRPGRSLELKTVFDSTRRQGEQTKRVTVYSNDPIEPSMELWFTTNVKVLYDTRPPHVVSLGAMQREVPSDRALEIVPGESSHAVKILKVEFGDAPLTYVSEPFEEKGKTGQRMRFMATRYAAMGTITAEVKIHVDVDGLERSRDMLLRGEIVGDLTFLPKVVDVTRQTSRRGQTLTPVTVRSTETSPFEIRGAAAGPWFDVTVEPKKNQPQPSEYVVSLTVRPEAPTGPFGTMLEIETDSLDDPLIRVPVFGNIAPPVAVEPPVVLLRQDGTPAGTTRRVRLQASPQDILQIRDLTCPEQTVDASVDDTNETGRHHLRILQVRLSGKLPPGIHHTVLSVATSIEGAEHLDIPVTIDVPG